jgi:hypothetical protein
MIEDMQIRNLAVHTQNTYVLQVSMFARHFGKSPEILGPEEIRTYQVYSKSLGPDGNPCEADTRGLLQRAYIVANWSCGLF